MMSILPKKKNQLFLPKKKKKNQNHFHFGEYIKSKNFCIWCVVVQKPRHPLRVTVWCGLWSGEVIGQYFFKNDNSVTTTGYLLYSTFSVPQNGATCHTSHATIEILRQTLPFS